jgi:hypothetical protein
MAASFDDAVAALYQAPHGEFVSARKRLAGELKSAGDKDGATRLGKLPRPPISAWTVNQLWWQARDDFDAILEAAAKLRDGNLAAQSAHRDALTRLRQRASTILSAAGHGSTEATLRRVATTLSAVAAFGGFDPDPPGALSADRDPPGFEAVGIIAEPAAAAPAKATKAEAAPEPEPEPEPPDANAETAREREATEKRAHAEAAAERRRLEQAEAKRVAELHKHEVALGSARSELERKQKDLDRLRAAVETAQATVDKSQAVVDELEAKLAEVVRETEHD